MWPWEHAAIGYLLYSLYANSYSQRRPGRIEVVAVLFGTQFPDLVDKPLAWVFGVLPGGQSLAHSLLVAVPLTAVVLVAGRGLGRGPVALAAAVGYLSHLPGDVVSPALLGSGLSTEFLLWPLTPVSAPVASPVGHLEVLLSQFLTHLQSPQGLAYVVAEFGLLSLALLVWAYDGFPGLVRQPR